MTREQFVIAAVILAACCAVSLIAGIWWGRRDGKDEIAALEADLEAAIARHPAGKRRQVSHDETWQGGHGGRGEPGTAPGGQATRSTWAAETAALPPLEPTSVIPPGESDTAWTRRMGLELEAKIAAMMAESEPWLREMTR